MVFKITSTWMAKELLLLVRERDPLVGQVQIQIGNRCTRVTLHNPQAYRSRLMDLGDHAWWRRLEPEECRPILSQWAEQLAGDRSWLHSN